MMRTRRQNLIILFLHIYVIRRLLSEITQSSTSKYDNEIITYLCDFSAVASKLILFGMAPVEAIFTGGGLIRLSVTLSELTSWLELLSDTDVSILFTESVLRDILLGSRFFSILDELMLTMLVRISDFPIREVILLTRFEVDIVAELMRVMRSDMADLGSVSGLSVSMPESKRLSYWDTERALKELSLEFSDL